MLHRHLLGRLLIAAGAASLALASPWPAVAGADAAQVTVVGPGGVQRPLSLDALAGSEDVRERGYLVRSAAGEETRAVSGFSLAAVLGAAGADTYGFSYLEVQRPVGGSVLLSRHQALDPGAFPEGPPVVYATAGGTGFLRPTTDAADANAGDCFEAPQGVTVVLRKGTALQVRASASARRVKPGQKVEFSASVTRAGAGEQLAYSWYFDDGGGAKGSTASHSFAKPGSYDVVVGVTTPGDDTGASAVVTVQVGAAATGGPDRRGGGRNDASGAPDHGAVSGPSGTGGGAGTGGAAETLPSAPVTAPAAAAPSPAAAPAPTFSPQPRPRPVHTQPAPAPGPDPGTEVSGLLLDESSAAASAAKPQAAARTGNPRGGEGGGFGLPAAAWGLLASAGLLGAGALLEARGLAGLFSFGILSR